MTRLPATLSADLTPEVLKRMDDEQLKQLAADLRRLLVRSVAVRGGHLGPNLGVVELTLALHRVFDSPRDVLLWDTGHQSYIHKMVTGRVPLFDELRAWGGLAGYPNREESEHDWVESSHAGNALAYAAGFALGRHDGHVVAIVGDGALTAGVALETLNDVVERDLDLILVINDNGRSYAPTTGALAAALRALRGPVGEQAAAVLSGAGVRYHGPVDGHDRVAVEEALRAAARDEGLRIVHAVTQKGRGYEPALADEVDHLHGVGPFDPLDGRPLTAPPGRIPVTEILARSLVEAGECDDRIHVITAAMGSASGLDPFRDRFPDRFHDVGIAEQYAVTLACGLAMSGARPVVAIHSTFLGRAFDQVLYEVGLHALEVVFLIDRAGITGGDGPSHNGLYDLAIAGHVPDALVLAPVDASGLKEALSRALEAGRPAFVRYSRALPAEPVARNAPAGPCERGLAVVGYGSTAPLAIEVAGMLRERGVPAEAEVTGQLLPVPAGLRKALDDADVVVVLEDHGVMGGFGEMLARTSGHGFAARLRVFGPPGRFLPHGDPVEVRRHLRLDADALTGAVQRLWLENAAGEVSRAGGAAPR
ncbi:1-deoxy-D-xylulose-5-phosphate synthase [Streptosporangium canum]|uniref:1-deoxy-D-xylulose-5-phosphate synthase n=1 Tax=Streptosporangium canum TaxID=324952 RepID=A0A1I3N0G5_9ACTN|nr:1-deoxy-D-xylulose-5-phosphate synthase [Streptosporangium canum]SFJ02682.1 1-deoxy-D-xylulose-5-phosphate synthase [Streptosporangium canum]